LRVVARAISDLMRRRMLRRLDGRALTLHATAVEKQPIKQEEQERAGDGGHESRGVLRSVPAELLAEVFCNQRACNSEKSCNNEPARITSGHEQFSHDADNEAGKECRDNVHESFLTAMHHFGGDESQGAHHHRIAHGFDQPRLRLDMFLHDIGMVDSGIVRQACIILSL
jgi:hypothetical protein